MYLVEVYIEDESVYCEYIEAKSEEEAEEILRKKITIEYCVSEDNGE